MHPHKLHLFVESKDSTVMYSDKSRIRIYKKSHYYRDFDVRIVRSELSKIPNDAIISSQSSILTQLSYRDKIYQFPIVKDAEFIIYSKKESSYPLEIKEFHLKIKELSTSTNWIKVIDKEEIVIYKKI